MIISLTIMSRSFVADERVLEAVAQASELSAENFGEICKLAVRLFGSDKQSKRRLTRTASASGWGAGQLEKAVLAIAKVLMDSVKAEMSEHAFRLVLTGMTLPEQHIDVLVQLYSAHGNDIRECVSRENGTSVPRYRNLEWRIDVEVLSTRLRVDYDGLKLMQRQLETALKEVDSVHCSRIQRYMN